MTNLKEILEVLSAPSYRAMYVKARATKSCIRCGKPAKVFRDPSVMLEYKASALCQNCQDYYFNTNEIAERIGG